MRDSLYSNTSTQLLQIINYRVNHLQNYTEYLRSTFHITAFLKEKESAEVYFEEQKVNRAGHTIPTGGESMQPLAANCTTLFCTFFVDYLTTISLSRQINDKLERIWKETVMA
jgi:hypothetical protein